MVKTRKSGFTLVELLVVIFIIAVLGTVSAVIGPKILKKGSQTKSVTDLRQVTMYLNTYAADNHNRLPPPVQTTPEDTEIYWHTLIQAEISGGATETYLADQWWRNNDSILINPVFPKGRINRATTGYGMNASLARNIAGAKGENMEIEDSMYSAVNLNAISDPSRTPIIMPFWTWAYQCEPENIADPKWEDLTVGGKAPVLFLDGHVEILTPREYVSRGLNSAPNR